MTNILSKIPERFFKVRYDQSHDGRSEDLPPMAESANCQNFAYEILGSFGFVVPRLRSSNLWADTTYTVVVEGEPQPLDLLLFNRTEASWGAHVAVCIGEGQAIHLSKRVGSPAILPIPHFAERPEYRVLVGVKRPFVHNS